MILHYQTNIFYHIAWSEEEVKSMESFEWKEVERSTYRTKNGSVTAICMTRVGVYSSNPEIGNVFIALN
jgi:hypothetical protein